MGKATIINHIAEGEYNITVNYDLASIEAAISNIDAKITELDALLTDIESELSDKEDEISGINDEISSNQEDLVVWENELAGATDQTLVERCNDKILEIQDDIDSFISELSDEQDDLVAKNNEISGLQSDLATAESNLSDAESVLSGLQSDMSDAQDNITYYTTQIQSFNDGIIAEIDTLNYWINEALGATDPDYLDYCNQQISESNARLATLQVNLSDAEDSLDAAESLVVEIEADITTAEGDVSNCQSEVDSLNADIVTANEQKDSIESDIADIEENITEAQENLAFWQNELSNATDETLVEKCNEEITEIEATIESLRQQLRVAIGEKSAIESRQNLTKLKKLSLEKRKEYLQNTDHVPEDFTTTAWCADYTTDLEGEVGVIEIGREKENGLNIQPGYDENAVFAADRDGQLVPLMAQTPEATFYNLAMLPGTQKWKPTYFYGEILEIDQDDDTCDVRLDNLNSSQQSLNIVQNTNLFDVPIEYMECNSQVFEEDDIVIVKFENYDFENPKVIGFKEEPRPCCWEEPWDGPLWTTKWPWQHLYTGSGGEPVIFPDNSIITLEDGVVTFEVGETPTGEQWAMQRHQWYYYPDDPVRERATSVYFDCDARDTCAAFGIYRNWMLALVGEKDGSPIYFQIHVLNNSQFFNDGNYIGCTEGEGSFPGSATETDWIDGGSGLWTKSVLHDHTDPIELPETGATIDYVVVQFESGADFIIGDDYPDDLPGGSIDINFIAVC